SINAKLVCQGVKEYVAGLIDGLRQIYFTMATLHPTTEPAPIEFSPTIAMNIKGLGNIFLPPRHRHNDFEGRTGRQLRLNRFVQQRLVGIIDQLAPVAVRDTYGEVVRIKC